MRNQPLTAFAIASLASLAIFAGLAGPAVADDTAAQRARIAAERAQAEAAHEARLSECGQRFAVTDCVNDARRQRREALDRLAQQQIILDEAVRRQRAAERIDAIRSKVAAADAEAGRRPPPKPPAASLRLREPAAARSREAAPGPPADRAVAAEQSRRQRMRRQQQRQAEGLAHREAVERRNAARAASGKKPAAPLPVPQQVP